MNFNVFFYTIINSKKMMIRPVLVESEDEQENAVLGCSGIMLQEKYVIITANIMLKNIKKNIFENLKPGRLYPELLQDHNITLNVVWTENGLFVVKKAQIFSPLISGNIRTSSKYIFQSWAIDCIENNTNLNEILSLFFILSFEKVHDIDDFKNTLKEWLHLLDGIDVNKGDVIYVRSNPFGNRNFMDSYSKGIVSNVLGNNSCFILSDCPSTPGSEGSPVYRFISKHLHTEPPIGVILSSVSWWRGEWVGLTLIADIKPIILELVNIPLTEPLTTNRTENLGILATAESSLVQVYCGTNWGTAILLNRDKGIFLTNSHVVEDKKIRFFCKGRSWNVNLLYRTPVSSALDLAVLKSETNILNDLKLQSIIISKKREELGASVFAAGFSLFTKDAHLSPTLTKGCISQINPFMIKTTCSVHPGASGGAILDSEGALLAVIVCNVKLHENNIIYPRISMSVPFSSVADIFCSYMDTEDITVLNNLGKKNQEAENIWRRLEGKL